jgi:hypothetical protein
LDVFEVARNTTVDNGKYISPSILRTAVLFCKYSGGDLGVVGDMEIGSGKAGEWRKKG